MKNILIEHWHDEYFRRVSVCMATYNGGKYLDAQLTSIAEQLDPRDELVLSDDASSDDTLACVDRIRSRFPALQIRMAGTHRAGGVVPNFERAIAAAAGDVIVLCDQDDVWLPGRVELIRVATGRADLVVLNGAVVDGNLQPRGQTVFELVGVREGFLKNLFKNSFIGCCMAFRREVRDRALPFPAGVPWHDWYIGLLVESAGRVERLDQVTMLYRRHGENFSPTGEKSGNSFSRKLMLRLSVARAVMVARLRRLRLGH